MRRTTISLPDDLASAVTREADRRRTSVSEVTRAALLAYLGIDPGARRQLPFTAIGRSGAGSVARDAEEILAREWDDDHDRDRDR
jgi:Arc/MetJ-type ribon-helix-helix transcriptional regulator